MNVGVVCVLPFCLSAYFGAWHRMQLLGNLDALFKKGTFQVLMIVKMSFQVDGKIPICVNSEKLEITEGDL